VGDWDEALSAIFSGAVAVAGKEGGGEGEKGSDASKLIENKAWRTYNRVLFLLPFHFSSCVFLQSVINDFSLSIYHIYSCQFH